MNNILYNFISPVTGHVLSMTGYVLVGNSAGIATPSPAVKDIRLDLINIRRSISTFTNFGTFIIQTPNTQLPNAQALNQLPLLPGIAKVEVDGAIAIAIAGIDYVTVARLDELIAEAEISVNNASNSENVASAAAIATRASDTTATGAAVASGASAVSSVFSSLGSAAKGIVSSTFAGLSGNAQESARSAQSNIENIALKTNLLINKFIRPNIVRINNENISISLLPVYNNINLQGRRIKNLSLSPQKDNDAVSAKWVLDLLNGNVIVNF